LAAGAALALLTSPLCCPAQVSLGTVVSLAQQKSPAVRLAQSDVQKAAAELAQTRDAFIPSVGFGSGLPAFPEIGFTGALPTIWDANVQSMVFSMPQIRYVQAARAALTSAQLALIEAREQVALEASTSYIELDAVKTLLEAAHDERTASARLVGIVEERNAAGVEPGLALLQARLAAAQIKLHEIELEARSQTLARQISSLTGLPPASILPDHASIPLIPEVKADEAPHKTAGIESAEMLAKARERTAKGDSEHRWMLPQISFGLIYNRNTTLLNNINEYYKSFLPANNLSSGFSIQVPIFDAGIHARSAESAADALRARVQAEQASRQNNFAIASLSDNLRVLDTQAEIAGLKQQIAEEQIKSVAAQMELGNGAGSGPGAPAQISPAAAQQAHIEERQRFEEAIEAGVDLNKVRLGLLRALGHMQDWLDELPRNSRGRGPAN